MKRNAEQKPAASEGVHQVSPGGTCLETGVSRCRSTAQSAAVSTAVSEM